MIDATLLRKLGWSKELIDSVTHAAEPLRENPASELEMVTLVEYAESGSAVYAGSAVISSAQGYTVHANRLTPARRARKPKKKLVRRASSSA
jgi:hypothetical protein